MRNDYEPSTGAKVLFGLGVLVLLLIGVPACMIGCPHYRVWNAEMSGRAELAQADGNRQIAIREAQAKQESAKSLAQAEIERAKGVAEANRIIGASLDGNEAYLHYLWIHSLQETKDKVIYVPTEANLPILEAARLAPPPTPHK